MRIHSKGGTVRTVLLDDRGYVTLLKLYLAGASYAHGPLFRAPINDASGPLSYDAARHRWKGYCAVAEIRAARRRRVATRAEETGRWARPEGPRSS
ncbi:hypothetical protein [Nonomuraea jabiensis]|uniref:hypothetical protein n=1 Tax=Nonomuraea jabiensis TaxID=882448 RepID=UPI003D74A024